MELDLIGQFSQYGLLGLILALVLWIAVQLWRDLKLSWEARINETKHLAKVIESSNHTYATIAGAMEQRARATEAVADAQLATARALEANAEVLRRLEVSVVELKAGRKQT